METTHLDKRDSISNGKMMDGDVISKLNENEESVEKTPSFREKLKDPVYKENIIYSFFLAAVFVSLGLYVGQHGPTLLDIQIITNTDLEASSAFFTGGNTGYLTGSIITGLIYNKINKALLIFIVTLGLGLTNIIVPYCAQYELMILIRFVTASFGGGIDTAINSEHMRIWGSDANGLLQFQHFCFSVGGLLSPLIAEPFLAEKADLGQVNNSMSNENVYSNATYHHRNVTEHQLNTTELPFSTSGYTSNATGLHFNATDGHDLRPTETRVEYLYIIVGIYSIISSIPFLILFLKKNGKKESTHQVEEKRQFSRKNVPFPLLIIMLCGICFFYFAYCCVEDTFFSFLMTFLVKGYDSISKSKGALTTAVAWASFALARFLMIFMSKILSTIQLLFLMTTSMAVAFSCFTIFASLGVVDALVIFSSISALSCSGVFASGFSWMETEMFQVTGLISSFILVASSLGSIVNPLIIGYLMEEVSNMWFCYLLVIDTFILCILFFVLLVYSRCYIDKKYGTLASSLETDIVIDSPEQDDSSVIKNGGVGADAHESFLH